jgi:hypothetical protein
VIVVVVVPTEPHADADARPSTASAAIATRVRITPTSSSRAEFRDRRHRADHFGPIILAGSQYLAGRRLRLDSLRAECRYASAAAPRAVRAGRGYDLGDPLGSDLETFCKPAPRPQFALCQDELPQGVSHVAFRRLDMTANLDAAPNPFDRDPRNVCEGLVAELDRSRQGRDDALVVGLSGGHC